MKAIIYSDLNAIDPLIGSKYVVEDIESVYRQLYNLFTTEKTEIYFDPLAGLNLDSNLFELIDEINAFQVLNDIIIDVKNQVPMCEPDFSNSEVIPDINNHGYKFNLSFNVIGVENDKQLQFYGALFK